MARKKRKPSPRGRGSKSLSVELAVCLVRGLLCGILFILVNPHGHPREAPFSLSTGGSDGRPKVTQPQPEKSSSSTSDKPGECGSRASPLSLHPRASSWDHPYGPAVFQQFLPSPTGAPGAELSLLSARKYRSMDPREGRTLRNHPGHQRSHWIEEETKTRGRE